MPLQRGKGQGVKPAASPCLRAADHPAFNEQSSPGLAKSNFKYMHCSPAPDFLLPQAAITAGSGASPPRKARPQRALPAAPRPTDPAGARASGGLRGPATTSAPQGIPTAGTEVQSHAPAWLPSAPRRHISSSGAGGREGGSPAGEEPCPSLQMPGRPGTTALP